MDNLRGSNFDGRSPRRGQWVTHPKYERPGVVRGFDVRNGKVCAVIGFVDEGGFASETAVLPFEAIRPLLDKNLIPEPRRKTMDPNWSPRP